MTTIGIQICEELVAHGFHGGVVEMQTDGNGGLLVELNGATVGRFDPDKPAFFKM